LLVDEQTFRALLDGRNPATPPAEQAAAVKSVPAAKVAPAAARAQ
jgi:hypothetical protein